ncbi:MAG: altronate dehydratase family protein [Synergistaceae bacterium]|jgi:altronate hydrolase|nr:altronate dehydratase family protein [Synergistaceae bacterium]
MRSPALKSARDDAVGSVGCPGPKFIRLNEADNVLVLPWGGNAGTEIDAFVLNEDVPAGHKVACADIAKGAVVLKYGRAIGLASRDIRRGDRVHEHNVVTRLGTEALPLWREPKNPKKAPDGAGNGPIDTGARTFSGFRRNGGRPGVRNDLWVIPSVGCVNGELRFILRNYRKPPWIDEVRLLEHPYGCSQLGGDLEATRDILTGLAGNPNAAGVLVVGLGCENLSAEELYSRIRESRGDAVKRVVLQTCEAGAPVPRLLDELAAGAPRSREEFPLSELCVGVKCGGSDGYSGLTANPLVGRFSDWLVSRGGTILATEIPEMFGAEEEVASRIGDRAVFDDFIALDRWFRDYFVRYGQPIYENPSPGNREGGITTLEEKSLGAVEKAGRAPVTKVLRYGQAAVPGGGVQITFAPGNDLVSCTSLAGSGAQLILFTTGRGTPFGSPTPTVKISTNTALAKKHPDWTDFDAGALLEGETWEAAEKRLIDCVLRTACGDRVAHERKGFGEIAIFRDGVTL